MTASNVGIIKDGPEGNIILEPANEMKIEFIIVGDGYLLKLKGFKGAEIITANEFLLRNLI